MSLAYWRERIVLGICSLLLVFTAGEKLPAQEDADLAEHVNRLSRQLNDDQAQRRDQAEKTLLELAPLDDAEACDKYLELLPQPLEGMPEEVKLRLIRLRREIETRQSDRLLKASRLSLSAENMKLETALEAIHSRTGNRLSDYREQFGQPVTPKMLTIDLQDEQFWPALDKILDQAALSLYAFSGEDMLALVNREPGAAGRSGRACYAGPFRVEAVNVVAQRHLRNANQQRAHVELEVAWEPRLRPIALSQSIENLQIQGDGGLPIAIDSQRPVLEVEVPPGSHATELRIPLALPPRETSKLAIFRGELSALVPGRMVEFQFKDLHQAGGAQQQRGGVKVSVDGMRKNRALWEVHMQIEVLSKTAGLESHRGWVFQNITYLLNKTGEVIDHAGFETTRQTEREVGLAYFFELPDDDIGSYTWVYRTPAAIVRVPVKYELKDIPLP